MGDKLLALWPHLFLLPLLTPISVLSLFFLTNSGGHAISHSGNVNFRMMVEKFKAKYSTSSRYEKARVIAEVVRLWRNQSPPGRFLIITDPTQGDASKWHDIGDHAASKKVAQSLRERNPKAEYSVAAAAAAAAAAPADPVPSAAVVPVPNAVPSSAAVGASTLPSVEWSRSKSQNNNKRNTTHTLRKICVHRRMSRCFKNRRQRRRIEMVFQQYHVHQD